MNSCPSCWARLSGHRRGLRGLLLRRAGLPGAPAFGPAGPGRAASPHTARCGRVCSSVSSPVPAGRAVPHLTAQHPPQGARPCLNPSHPFLVEFTLITCLCHPRPGNLRPGSSGNSFLGVSLPSLHSGPGRGLSLTGPPPKALPRAEQDWRTRSRIFIPVC